jgi:hypothetical protein
MQDGRIVREHSVASPYEEDLKAFRDSGVGQAILKGDDASLNCVGSEEREMLKRVLEAVA